MVVRRLVFLINLMFFVNTIFNANFVVIFGLFTKKDFCELCRKKFEKLWGLVIEQFISENFKMHLIIHQSICMFNNS